jgi:ribonuclease P protein component
VRWPRSARLRRHNDFLKVERTGVRAHGAFVTLVARPGRGRVGLTVSKKVSLHAVVRNRIRRRLKEAVRHHKAWIAGTDVVIIAKPTAVERSLAELRADLATAFAALANDSRNDRRNDAAKPPRR